jgi:hypothetical protein
MHYAEFDDDESAALFAAIKEYDSNKWKTIGQKLGKPAKVSCFCCVQRFPKHGSQQRGYTDLMLVITDHGSHRIMYQALQFSAVSPSIPADI